MRFLCGKFIFFELLLLCCGCGLQHSEESINSSQSSKTAPAGRHYLGQKSLEVVLESESAGETKWRDETDKSGVRFHFQNGQTGGQFTLLESVGGGATLFDFDNDGDLDLFLPAGGTISAGIPLRIEGLPVGFYLNDGQGHFSAASSRVRLTDPVPYSHAAFAADFDRDGFVDLLMTGFQGVRLLRNDQGKSLIDVTASTNLPMSDWITAACWGDLNRDGWPDLLVTGYAEWSPAADEFCGDKARQVRDVCPPQKYPAARQRLYLNSKDGRFSEVPNGLEGTGRGKGMGALAMDLNGDNWIDFYIANDQVANQLYLGGPAFPLREVAVPLGVAGSEFGVPEGSMGVDASDFDGDGLPDLWVTNYELEDNSLYRNLDNTRFGHWTVRAGLGGQARAFVKFGTGFADFDLDGWLDLFVISGHVLYETGKSAYRQPSFLLHNESSGNGRESSGNSRRFRDITQEAGGEWFRNHRSGRGAAVGDLDNDGDLDLIVVEQNGPVSVLFNQTQPKSWLSVRLLGIESDPRAIGATVLYSHEGRVLARHIRSGAGYLSQFDDRILFPSTEGGPRDVQVKWLTGKTEWFRNLPPNQTSTLTEGQGESQ